MNKTLVILTWDKCKHCIQFKNQKNESGMSNMDELIHRLNKDMPSLSIKTVNITDDGSVTPTPIEFTEIKNKWFPSIYLFTTDEFNSGNMKNGKIMGGTIIDNTAQQDGSRISMTTDFIISWINNSLSSDMESTYQYEKLPRYLDYVSRLNRIK